MKNSEKIEALAFFLSVEIQSIEQSDYDENTFIDGSEEYLVLMNSEADELAG